MKSKTLLIAAAILAVGAAGVWLGRNLPGATGKGNGTLAKKVALGSANETQSAAVTAPDQGGGDIPTAQVEAVAQDVTLRLTGSLAADERSDVASTANGLVLEVLVERGSLVKKGDVLVRVDPTDTKNMLAEATSAIEELKAALGWDGKTPFTVEEQPGVKMAKAALDLATANYKRFTDLFAQHAVSKAAFDQAQTEYDASQQRYEQALHQTRQLYQSYNTAMARLATLNKMVADTTIVAPFGGWVSEKYVSKGERATTNPMGAGAKVVTLVKDDPLRLMLTVPQQQISLVREGQTVKFSVDGYPGKTFTGEVKNIGPSVENMSRSCTVEALVPNPDRLLRPGFFATAELVLPEKKTGILVPASAVVTSQDTAKVYVVREGKAVEQVVSAGGTENGQVLITSGLAAGDRVVTAPERIRDGAKVN